MHESRQSYRLVRIKNKRTIAAVFLRGGTVYSHVAGTRPLLAAVWQTGTVSVGRVREGPYRGRCVGLVRLWVYSRRTLNET